MTKPLTTTKTNYLVGALIVLIILALGGRGIGELVGYGMLAGVTILAAWVGWKIRPDWTSIAITELIWGFIAYGADLLKEFPAKFAAFGGALQDLLGRLIGLALDLAIIAGLIVITSWLWKNQVKPFAQIVTGFTGWVILMKLFSLFVSDSWFCLGPVGLILLLAIGLIVWNAIWPKASSGKVNG